MQKLVIGGVYRHFKGDFYKVTDVAHHSETNEELVIYQGLFSPESPSGYEVFKDSYSCARPKEMFLSPMDKEKYPDVQQEYRFQLIKDAENNDV
jgi:hypothetical protein